MASDVLSQRLQRVYENTKRSLNIETQVSPAGQNSQATIYHMDISFRSTRNKWSIAKRYSEFFNVRHTLRKFVKQHKQQFATESSPLPPILALERALDAPFPRRHVRNDTAAIIDERKPALEAFVQMLVKVISSIPMSDSTPLHAASPTTSPVMSPLDSSVISPASILPAPLSAQAESMVVLYQILRNFLEYPDKQIESETRLKLAVLSLEDVVVSSQTNVLEANETLLSDCCSICLGEWNDEDCADMNVVKLPCLHAFHEECLMEWLHSNTHCPMCRDEPTPPSTLRDST